MKTILIILMGVVIVLLLLSYFNNVDNKQELKEQRELYEDSLQRYAYTQELIEAEKRIAIKEKDKELARQIQTKEVYERENLSLKAELRKSRTPKVEQLIEDEPELQLYISMYDSLLGLKDLRIDSLEVEKRIAQQLYETIQVKSDSLLSSKEQENQYLKNEVTGLYERVDKLEKKLKKEKWYKWLFFGLGAATRVVK